jgi:hypothetical protein
VVGRRWGKNRSQELGFRRQESGGGYMGQGKGAILNCELSIALLLVGAAWHLPLVRWSL